MLMNVKSILCSKQIKVGLPQVKLSAVKVPSGAKQIGNYILGKTIGQGSSGKVHIGLHILTGERVAVKIIDKKQLKSGDRQKIEQQIETLKKVMHQSLIQLYEIIQTQKSILFITEYIQQGELFDYIIQKRKISQQQSCQFFHQIIDGIQYMHSLGIAHRDIKPENILVDFNGKVKIIDFGLSNVYEKNQRLQTVCGSPCYVSPEILQKDTPYEPLLVDIWSTGIVLFVMLTGYLPFCDPDTSTLYKKILTGSFKCPAHVSMQAKDLISKILVVNPLKRATLRQIMEHPWYKQLNVKKLMGIDSRIYKIPIQTSIVNCIQNFGIKGSEVIESVENNVRNKETALYYIIAKKLVREGHHLPSYFGCDYFDFHKLKLLTEDKETVTVDVDSVIAVPILGQVSSPQTTSFQLYHAKSAAFNKILNDFMNTKKIAEDKNITVMKGDFYANNLENKKKQKHLVIHETKPTTALTKSDRPINFRKLIKVNRKPQLTSKKIIESIYLSHILDKSKKLSTQSNFKNLPTIQKQRLSAPHFSTQTCRFSEQKRKSVNLKKGQKQV